MVESRRIKPIKPRKNKKAIPKEEIYSVSDDFGNLLVCKNNGTRILISLKLVAETSYRHIGTVNLKERNITMKRDRAKHLFRKTNSYGFNYNLLAQSKLFDHVRLVDNFEEWKIPKQVILDTYKFLEFKGVGFERQVFMTLDQLAPYKRPTKI